MKKYRVNDAGCECSIASLVARELPKVIHTQITYFWIVLETFEIFLFQNEKSILDFKMFNKLRGLIRLN